MMVLTMESMLRCLIPIGKYKLQLEIKAPTDYLLHVDSETGVPAARDNGLAAAEEYFKTQNVEFDWTYTLQITYYT